MSLTFSNRREVRSDRAAIRGFESAVWITVAVATLIAVVALTVYALQGPRLRSGALDLVRAVAAPQTALRLEADRPLQPIQIEQVSIEPSVDFRVEVQGSLASVVFLDALDYGTTYRVTLNGMVGVGQASSASWEYEFSTPAARLFYLDRGEAGEGNRIFSVGMDGEPPTEVYRADHIDVFVPIGSTVVAFSSDEDGARADLVEPVSGRVDRMVLPADVVVNDVFAPASGTRVAFTLSSTGDGEYDRTLFVLDTAGARTPVPVAGLDGEPLRVTEAAVVPASDTLIAWVDDVRVVSVDLRTSLVLPVAEEAAQLWGVSSRGDKVVMVDLGGTVAIDLVNLEETRVIPGQLSGRDVFEGQTLVLSDGRRIQTVALGNAQGTDFTSLIAIGDERGLSPLYRTPEDRGSIGTFVPSPSDQYLAIETIPDRARRESDNRGLEPRDLSSTIAVVEVETGQVVRSVEGVWPVWAR
jgi:hypothetical protein